MKSTHKTHLRLARRIANNTSGETLVETLVSVLISSLALLMLATAIGSAVKIVMRSRYFMQDFYTRESQMVANSEDPGSGSDLDVSLDVALTKDSDGDVQKTIRVKSYTSEAEGSNVSLYEVSTP